MRAAVAAAAKAPDVPCGWKPRKKRLMVAALPTRVPIS